MRSVNLDVVGPAMPVVVTSPISPTPIGTGFCCGMGIDRAGEDLGRGTKSSTDEMDIVGLRSSRWVGLDRTPCTFWGTVRGGDVGDHEGGGRLSSVICFGGSTGVLSAGSNAGWGSSSAVGLVACGGGSNSTSGIVFGGSSVTRVSRAG